MHAEACDLQIYTTVEQLTKKQNVCGTLCNNDSFTTDVGGISYVFWFK